MISRRLIRGFLFPVYARGSAGRQSGDGGGSRRAVGGATKLTDGFVYKEHRIHSSRLASGPWLGLIVKLGRKKAMTKDSLTATVTRVPGEYDSEEEAIRTAKRYIDDEEKPPSAEAAD